MEMAGTMCFLMTRRSAICPVRESDGKNLVKEEGNDGMAWLWATARREVERTVGCGQLYVGAA